MASMVGKLRDDPTLNTFGRCFIAQAHDIFNKIPEDTKKERSGERVDESCERWPKIMKDLRGEEKQNDGDKKGTNKTKHTKPEIYSAQLVNELNGMV